MFERLRHHTWSTGDILALIGIVATILVAIVGPARHWVARLVRDGMLRVGRPEHRYASWFIAKWGQYENPYLADTENLDLSTTFVSLAFRERDGDQEVRSAAIKVLADRKAGNLVIEGAPGSGKSTLLKAYGVGILKSKRRSPLLRKRSTDIPFFVQLRKFARTLDRTDAALADYLIDDILVSGCGMTPAAATEFLLYALQEGRALVMLDGLDEVGTDRYPALLEAVHRFLSDHSPLQPTHRARIIVTCRRQNFLSLRDQWVPVIARQVCTLAPLRNSEIFSYLHKLRSKFKSADGPEDFFQAVRASGTLDLHRVPLILAMSVGLYARKDYYEIPNSIAKLYQTMIEEMLDRQRFKRDPGGSLVTFQVDDKYRFLREFALHTALSADGFNDFQRKNLNVLADELAPRLNAVTEPAVFVNEIVQRSGLLTDVSEAGRYVFAHRSIHEYLAAEELQLLPGGAAMLDERANDPEWRQVILFYATARDQRSADDFLAKLSRRNGTLAAHCLGGAKASDEVAAAILDSLGGVPEQLLLPALVAATMSPRQSVQEMAVRRLETELSRSIGSISSAFSTDVDGMLPLLNSLVGSNTARIAALVPTIVASVPDDPRLVEPLWRCLTAPEIEKLPACNKIVERLLTIAMDPDGLTELQGQEPYTRPFLTGPLRLEAYPFSSAVDPTSNLVTLLAWAEHLNVMPARPNRFFEAKKAGRLRRLESDRRRTVSFSLFWPARIYTAVGTLLALAGAAAVIATEPRMLLQPVGWWSPLLSVGAAVTSFAIFLYISLLGEKFPEASRFRPYLASETPMGVGGHIGEVFARFGTSGEVHHGSAFAALLTGPLAFTVAITHVATLPVVTYLSIAVGAPLLLFWFPALDFCARTTRFYLYRPSPYVDAYDDPQSKLWLSPAPPGPPQGSPESRT